LDSATAWLRSAAELVGGDYWHYACIDTKDEKKIEIGRDQAAVRIQALYRGYQVRKFQSLRKLREFMKIRGRIEELRQQMSSPKFVGELSGDSKTRGKFNETLMGLLLQLDTIQGLHPVV
jgi:hypothetical protein